MPERNNEKLVRKAKRANNRFYQVNVASNLIKIGFEVLGTILSIILVKNWILRIIILAVSLWAFIQWAREDERLAKVERLYKDADLDYDQPDWAAKALDKDAELDRKYREKLGL